MTTHAGHLRPAPARPAKARVDRTAYRAARRVFRPRRTWPAMLAAVLLTAAGVLVAVETISGLAGSPTELVDHRRVLSWLGRTSWNDPVTIAAGAVVALLGLACLMAGLKPGHTSLVQLRGDDPELVVGVTKGGLRRAVATAAGDVEMVGGVKVKVRRHRVAVAVETPLRQPDGLAERVEKAVSHRLEELGPRPRRSVSVRVRKAGGDS
ncbi:DUF6286 domain-containing protein [Thermomonospora umbrina]|uniref:DUF6286 domain-containing protein n=1 Tax=Thermomonospora umbrina TaxID=111806 RepID=A0A3D9SRU9_9ACTN|nr:DUF6286 domain-containing protein [Thermomonospora umbrina]REE98662.1 hypothetical protein DFJ69_4155 [Thermomonospora umbrina]